MRVFYQPFFVQKEGNELNEYEDAFVPVGTIEATQSPFRLAIADGATESSFSAVWARMLASSYACGELRDDAQQHGSALARLQWEWSNLLAGADLPWYAEAKIQQGAFSSLLGMSLYDPVGEESTGHWCAMACGDSSLFHVRDDALLIAFPLVCSGDYTSRPVLISSLAAPNRHLDQHIRYATGAYEHDDQFYLMTDALAHWFLQSVEAGERPWRILADFDTSAEVAPFADWIAELRRMGRIRNDDVTMVRLNISV